MTTTCDDLARALVDVRKAYRLLHAYHRRLCDLLQTVDEAVSKRGLQFRLWAPENVDRLPKANRPFFTNWAWDLTPAYQIQCTWWSAPKKGKVRRIDIEAIADTGYDARLEKEPDAAQFKDAEQCSTELWISAWTASTAEPAWGDAMGKLEGIAERWDSKPHALKVDGATYTYQYLKTVDVAGLVDALAVREQVLVPIESWLDAPP